MGKLSHLKVGDMVVVTDVNHPACRSKVTKIGRKYIHVTGRLGSAQFDIETGRINDDHGHQNLHTIEEYEFTERVQKARQELRNFGIEVTYKVNPATVLDIREALDKVMQRGPAEGSP
jgi:hypothetical protein